jgi:hypothetical protein
MLHARGGLSPALDCLHTPEGTFLLSNPQSKPKRYRPFLVTALISQIVATSAGIAVVYSCLRQNPPFEHPFLTALYYGIIGPPGLMFLGAHVTVIVLALMLLLFWLGFRWRRVRILWFLAILLWGIWWVTMSYVICTD